MSTCQRQSANWCDASSRGSSIGKLISPWRKISLPCRSRKRIRTSSTYHLPWAQTQPFVIAISQVTHPRKQSLLMTLSKTKKPSFFQRIYKSSCFRVRKSWRLLFIHLYFCHYTNADGLPYKLSVYDYNGSYRMLLLTFKWWNIAFPFQRVGIVKQDKIAAFARGAFEQRNLAYFELLHHRPRRRRRECHNRRWGRCGRSGCWFVVGCHFVCKFWSVKFWSVFNLCVNIQRQK